jgi:light-regulated signal transduction histidine kinase (bacteriophytochrome)
MGDVSRAHQPGPGFGEADLSNCEREQIHLAGSIQPHGALLVVSEPDLVIRQASANAPRLLGWRSGVLGLALAALSSQLDRQVRRQLDSRLDRLPVAFRCMVPSAACDFDGLLHRPPAGGLVIELEPAQGPVALADSIEPALKRLLATTSLEALCDETARVFKRITGYDRVMVYRFDDDGHGQVFAEQHEPGLESFLGNRYPASDIPEIARRLYLRNRVRLLVDVDYSPALIDPRESPSTGAELDMSLCQLRSMSPIHLQYLKNMGVAATLVISLPIGGRLWGLIACHHMSSRFVPYQTRALCELLAEAVATRVAALSSFAQAQTELFVRRLEQRMMAAVSHDGDWKSALFDNASSVLAPLNASGAALLCDNEVLTAGEVPGTGELRELAEWLDRQPREAVMTYQSLPAEVSGNQVLRTVAAGLLAVPLGSTGGEYLLWLRPEQVRTVTWGGNPFKPVEVGDDPSQLSPRRSFSQWHQLVQGTCEPWTNADRSTARLIGESVADVLQQFRAVRLLIVQQQLEQISAGVDGADQPIVIADRDGRVLRANDAFTALLGPGVPAPAHLDHLIALAPQTELGRRLGALRERLTPWRGEVFLERTAKPATYMVRADPVLSGPQVAMGFVVLFTETQARTRAEAAQRRFQEGVLAPTHTLAVALSSQEDVLYRKLFSNIAGNAQLAALEITDGVDLTRMAELLDGVQASVSRSAELLEHLLWYEQDDRDTGAG